MLAGSKRQMSFLGTPNEAAQNPLRVLRCDVQGMTQDTTKDQLQSYCLPSGP